MEEQDRFAEPADGVAEPEGVGGLEVGEGENSLLRVGEGFEEMAAHDSGEDTAREGRRQEPPGLFDEEIADGSFGQLAAFVEEDHFVEAFGADAG